MSICKVGEAVTRFARMSTALVCFFGAANVPSFAQEASTTFEVVHSFSGSDGSCPLRELVRGVDGAWYGITAQGGAHGGGTLFRLDTGGAPAVTVIHSFDPSQQSQRPNGLARGQDGRLYGSTYGDFGADPGSIFVLTTNGEVETIGAFTNGRGVGPITFGRDGKLYGTVASGGTYGEGYIYSMTTAGQLTHLHSFGGTGAATAAVPIGPVTEGPDGAFYGTTNTGGAYQHGELYRVTPNGTYTTLHSFGDFSLPQVDGQQPWDGIAVGQGNLIYGTTAYGGQNGKGTVFRFDNTTARYAVLSDFAADDLEGRWAYSGPRVFGNAVIFGTTTAGGAGGLGTVFKIVGRRTTALHAFAADGSEGASPGARLVIDRNGDVLGSACQGGAYGAGTIFKLRRAAPNP